MNPNNPKIAGTSPRLKADTIEKATIKISSQSNALKSASLIAAPSEDPTNQPALEHRPSLAAPLSGETPPCISVEYESQRPQAKRGRELARSIRWIQDSRARIAYRSWAAVRPARNLSQASSATSRE